MRWKACAATAVLWLALAAPVVAQPGSDESEEFAKRFILRALELLQAPVSDCSGEVLDRYAGVQPICASFRGSFSSLKSSMEMDLRRMEFAALAEPLDAWAYSGGVYHREFKVHQTLVTADFDERAHSIVATYGGEPPPEPPAEAEDEKPAEGAGEPGEEDPEDTDDGGEKEPADRRDDPERPPADLLGCPYD